MLFSSWPAWPHPSESKFLIWAAKLVGKVDASNLVMGATPLVPSSNLVAMLSSVTSVLLLLLLPRATVPIQS